MNFVVLVFNFAVASATLPVEGSFPSPIVDNSRAQYPRNYIWMPDGNGVPHLVDLSVGKYDPEDILRTGGSDNKYLLFTRRNPFTPQVIDFGNATTILNSYYHYRRPLTVVVHGWRSSAQAKSSMKIKEALLENTDDNVILVDWKDASQSLLYWPVVQIVPDIGQFLGIFIRWLFDITGGDEDTLHLVGLGLGAHVVGNAGRSLSGQLQRITGLDPVFPGFDKNPYGLKASDGLYVEVIHTNGFGTVPIGFSEPIGDTDFYPNGGKSPQPGCPLLWIMSDVCSHYRAFELFAASIYKNSFKARKCIDLDDAMDGVCSGEILRMGNTNLRKMGSGIYSLKTTSKWPYTATSALTYKIG